MLKVPCLRAFQAFRVRICRKLRHLPRSHTLIQTIETLRVVTFTWGFTPPLYPSVYPFYPILHHPIFGMGFFYNKGGLFCDYAILHPLSDLASLPIFEEAALQADLYSLI